MMKKLLITLIITNLVLNIRSEITQEKQKEILEFKKGFRVVLINLNNHQEALDFINQNKEIIDEKTKISLLSLITVFKSQLKSYKDINSLKTTSFKIFKHYSYADLIKDSILMAIFLFSAGFAAKTGYLVFNKTTKKDLAVVISNIYFLTSLISAVLAVHSCHNILNNIKEQKEKDKQLVDLKIANDAISEKIKGLEALEDLIKNI